MTDTTPTWMHAFCSLTYLGAMLASKKLLFYVILLFFVNTNTKSCLSLNDLCLPSLQYQKY